MATYLVVNRGTGECYELSGLDEVARVTGADRDDLSWSLKRTGRWDREDRVLVVVPAEPCV